MLILCVLSSVLYYTGFQCTRFNKFVDSISKAVNFKILNNDSFQYVYL